MDEVPSTTASLIALAPKGTSVAREAYNAGWNDARKKMLEIGSVTKRRYYPESQWRAVMAFKVELEENLKEKK